LTYIYFKIPSNLETENIKNLNLKLINEKLNQ